MPRTLTEPEIESFRQRICDVATRLFAEHGYDGVTLRAITAEVGCSRMTPYRYFSDKAEILAAVRAEAFGRFADSMQAAFDAHDEPGERLGALCGAYFDFAAQEPHAYKIMFDYLQAGEHRELDKQGSRARKILFRAFKEAAAAGHLQGDPQVLAHVCWSTLHGAIVLHFAGQLQFGPDLDQLRDWILEEFVVGGSSILRDGNGSVDGA